MKSNNEIRMAAQAIYRRLATAIYNDTYGEDDGSRFTLSARMTKAIDWAKENGEYDALRLICHQMGSTAMGGMMAAYDEAFSLFEI